MTKLARKPKIKKTSPSLVEQLEADPTTAAELEAARLSSRAHQVLRRAFEASNLSQKDLAEILNVGESRVSQVLNGDGNMRVTSLARYLRALGCTAEITARPIDPDLPSITIEPRNRSLGRHVGGTE